MKKLDELSSYIEKKQNEFIKNCVEAQKETAEQIWADVIEIAPMGNGDYISSIQIDPTEVTNSTIKTFIGSDMTVGPTIWGSVMGSNNNMAGSVYNLGYLLENGTLPHPIPNAFNKGFYYGYTDNNGTYHKGTLDDDWHPGTIAQPHYFLALEKNKKLYKDKIRLAWRKTK